MVETLLLAGIMAAPLGSAGLFVPARRRRRPAGFWPSTRRLMMALAGTCILAAVVAAALRLLGVSRHNLVAAAAGLAFASLVWLPVTRRWKARAHLCWASSVFLFVVYLTFALDWTFASNLGAASTAGGVVLWIFELFAALLSCAYLWEICDAVGTEHWRRRVTAEVPMTAADAELPFVSLHVPAHNEPPDMVIDTLTSLVSLDYPRYEVILIDDNTDDERLWRPVEAWCAGHGVTFVHLENWPGYKSGALNYALRRLTDPRAELIGVVDSDYQIEPGFLRRCAPAFADPWVGFIQAPQDYRGWSRSRYYRRLYYSYAYFFAVSQPSRNERDGAIFAGTMGLIRRAALDALGGWDEWCITEDAELSLRLLRAGWHGLHVDQSWGKGIMPLTFEALKGQRYRWCFGGIQILRMHWRSLLPGRGTKENHLSMPQRWAYLAGGIQWYGDLLGLIFFVFLLAGAANLAVGGGELFRKLTPFLVATVPVLVGLGLVRAVALLRRGTGASWRDAIGAFFIWQSTSLVVARASLLGLFSRKAAFLRTPKTSEQARWWEALRANWAESVLALIGVAAIVSALTKATPAQRPAAGGAAGVPHARPGRRTGQQPGISAGCAAARAWRKAAHRIPPGQADLHRRCHRGWRGRGVRRRDSRCRHAARPRPPPGTDPGPGGAGPGTSGSFRPGHIAPRGTGPAFHPPHPNRPANPPEIHRPRTPIGYVPVRITHAEPHREHVPDRGAIVPDRLAIPDRAVALGQLTVPWRLVLVMMTPAKTIMAAAALQVRVGACLAAVSICAGLGVAAAGCGAGTGPHPSQQAAARFLATYARPDGRVVRLDQGGDTVSEGQAYGMLLAEAAGNDAAAGRIWAWTRDHLQLGNGLFAWHADAAGKVIGQQPASDADLLIAWALLRYRGPGAATWQRDGRRVATAIAAHEVTTGPGGVPVLAAGPWATGRPASLDPSYWSLTAFQELARLTGDQIWHRLATGAVTVTRELTQDGQVLPPDWAELSASGALRPEPAPDGSQPQIQYGPDAQRTVIWFAASCDSQARALAARWWPLLRPGGHSQALALSPGGSVLNATQATLPMVASAAAAKAAGNSPAAQKLLQRATAQQQAHPTYYGAAWSALGPALLSATPLSTC